jgi:hypothetical protein
MPVVLEDELEKLKKYNKNAEWLENNYGKLKNQYKGEYVAVGNEQLIGNHKDFQILINDLHQKYNDISSFVIRQINEKQIEYII